jgi:2'-5' RNA ligase
VKGIPPFTVNVRYVSGFPTPRRPRVIWAGVTGSDYLAAIYEALRQGLAQSSLDVKIEKRAYTPHITLGRAKNKCPPHLVDNLEQSAHAEFGTCTVDRIVLYQSTLTRKGAQYDPVHSFMFER